MQRRYGLATADAIVQSTAIEPAADALTCDARLDPLPATVFVEKARA